MPLDPLLVDLALPFYPAFRPEAWSRLAATGPPWCGVILRGGHGLHDDGPRLREHAIAIREAGLELGLYWYPLLDQDGAAQADAFAELMIGAQPTLLPIVDVEGGGNEDATAAQVTTTTRAFVERIRERTGQETILYAGGWLRSTLGRRARDLGCELLWLSAYTPHPQGYYEPLGFRLDELWGWQYAGADGLGMHVTLAGYPDITPIGLADVSAIVMRGGIDRAWWVERRGSVCETGPGR